MNPTHNYLKEIARLRAAGQLPQTGSVGCTEIAVSHDDWCGVYDGRRCNCEPTVKSVQPNRAQRRAQKRK